MVAKLDNNYVAKICKKRGYKLVKYISIRKKVEVVCNTCKRPGSVWWSCIRDGHGCKWCAGNKIDLYQAFIDKQLKPNEPITTSRQKVKCICLGCKDEELYSTCEFYLKRRESTPCWRCSPYQQQKRDLFLSKGWELFERYEKRKSYNVTCVNCGHKSDIDANTVEKWQANCQICREQRLLILLGLRLKTLKGKLIEPISLKDLKTKNKCLCLKCNQKKTFVFKDIVYGNQGFCEECGRISSAEKRRKYDLEKILSEKNLILLTGEYQNEKTIIKYKCQICNLDDQASIAALRVRTTSCLYCEGRKLKVDPLQIFRDKGLIPQESFTGHQIPLLCICTKCNQETSPTRLSLQQGHSGCRCINKEHPGVYTKSFFTRNPDYLKIPGGLYLVKFKDKDNQVFNKVGIHQALTKRVQAHRNLGGKCISYLLGPLYECWMVEKKILSMVKERKYVPLIKLRGGATECFSGSPVSLTQVWSSLFGSIPVTCMEGLGEGYEADKIILESFRSLSIRPQLELTDISSLKEDNYNYSFY